MCLIDLKKTKKKLAARSTTFIIWLETETCSPTDSAKSEWCVWKRRKLKTEVKNEAMSFAQLIRINSGHLAKSLFQWGFFSAFCPFLIKFLQVFFIFYFSLVSNMLILHENPSNEELQNDRQVRHFKKSLIFNQFN